MSALAPACPHTVPVGPFARLAVAAVAALAVAGVLADFTARDRVTLAAGDTSPTRAAAIATNAERAGTCKPLRPSQRLNRAAQRHANDMAARGYFSHTSKSGRAWDDRIRAAGYRKPGGENIAFGYSSGRAVVAGWMGSPGHRRNIMDCSFTRVGYGYSGGYWVQDFGR